MSIRSDITKAMQWYRGERKVLTVVVTDATNNAVNLTTTNMSWRILKEQGSATVYLQKTSGLVASGNNGNIVTITIDPDADYNTLPSGIHWHQLRDEDNDAELSYGDVHVQASAGRAV